MLSQRSKLTIKVDKAKIIPDILVFVGFVFDFLYSGETLGQLGFIFVCIAGLICLIEKGFSSVKCTAFIYAYGVLVIYFALMNIGGASKNLQLSNTYLNTMIKCLGYMFFAYQYLTQRSYQEITNLFLFVCIAILIYLIFTGNIFLDNRYDLNKSGMNANSIGLLYAFTVVMLGFRLINKESENPLVIMMLIMIMLGVILMTGSRKAFFLCFFPTGLYWIFVNKRNMFFRCVILAGALFVVYMLIMNVPVLYNTIGYRVEGILSFVFNEDVTEASLASRLKFIKIGMNAFATNPWRGYGLAAFSTLQGAYGTYSHNNYIEMLVSGGIPAVVMFYFPFVLSIVNCFKLKQKDAVLVLVLMVLMAYLLLHFGLVAYYTRRELFIYLFLFAIISNYLEPIRIKFNFGRYA